MKKIIVSLIIATLWLGACTKDSSSAPDTGRDDTVSGQVVNTLTQEPVQGMRISAYYLLIDDDWNMQMIRPASAVTDENGRFSMQYHVQKSYNDVHLKMQIPAGFQYSGAWVNGVLSTCIEENSDIWYNNSGPLVQKGGGEYQIELLPATYARIVRPAFPAPWQTASLKLRSDNLSFYGGYGLSGLCGTTYADSIKFIVVSNQTWTQLAHPLPLRLGNHIQFSYELDNGREQKSGSFGVDCVWGDTTDVELLMGL